MFNFWKCGVSSIEKEEKLNPEKIKKFQWLNYRPYWDAHSDLLAIDKIASEEDIMVVEQRGSIGHKVDQTMKGVSDIVRQKRISRGNKMELLKTNIEIEFKSKDDSCQKIENWKKLIVAEEKKVKQNNIDGKCFARELEITIRDRSHIEYGERYFVLNKHLPIEAQETSKEHLVEIDASSESDCLLTPIQASQL